MGGRERRRFRFGWGRVKVNDFRVDNSESAENWGEREEDKRGKQQATTCSSVRNPNISVCRVFEVERRSRICRN